MTKVNHSLVRERFAFFWEIGHRKSTGNAQFPENLSVSLYNSDVVRSVAANASGRENSGDDCFYFVIFHHFFSKGIDMYQEIKSDSLRPILQAIENALADPETLSVTLNKRADHYEATLVQVSPEPDPPPNA
jgi:hypothetical protein